MDENLSDLSDETLMTYYQSGHEVAFNILYRKYSSVVYGYLKKRLKDSQATDEVFQSAFIKLHASRMQFSANFLFAPWLFTIARSALLDFKKSQFARNKYIEYSDTENINVQINPWPQEEHQLLLDLELLPEPQRSAIEMRYLEDVSFKEIAKRLATTPTNIRQIISRGLRKLRLKAR